jgi:hypothetical protein
MEKATNIEPGIRPLVDALNAIPGVKTIGSCEGHVRWPGWLYKVPYVYFQAPNDVAEHIANFLRQDMATRRPHMRQAWIIQGLFHPERGLCFHLMLARGWGLFLRRLDQNIFGRTPNNARSVLDAHLRHDTENLAGLVRLYEPVQQPTEGAGGPHQIDEERHPDTQDNETGIFHSLALDKGVATQGANLGVFADHFLALGASHHSHSKTPSGDVTAESLADLLVRTLHRSAAMHGDTLSRRVIAEALAITTIRTVGIGNRMMGFLGPKDFRRPQ